MPDGSPYSLKSRLLLSATAVLLCFLGLMGLVLDQAFQRSAEQGVRERLLLQIYGILAVAEPAAEDLFLPDQLQEPRLNRAGSGLFAVVTTSAGREIWRSPSSVDLLLGESATAVMHTDLGAGQERFGRMVSGGDLFYLSYKVLWQVRSGESPGNQTPYVFTVFESMAPYESQIRGFRNNLWGWLIGVIVVLIVVQALVMRWGLAPLKQLEDDLKAIEDQRQETLDGHYPAEIEGVTRNLNLLLAAERQQRERYRTTMADLAHSLKTPLAILRGSVPDRDADIVGGSIRETVDEQVTRMDQIIAYQLERAVKSAPTLTRRAIDVSPLATRLIAAMEKVYLDKQLSIQLQAEPCSFAGDERDLLEMLGNVLDNACKYGHHCIRISARPDGKSTVVVVEDDGDGIAPGLRTGVLARGARLDSREAGQGIGLAVVAEIVDRYSGAIQIGASEMGGASVRLSLPGNL
jgi:two-component system sensor histidine kinase PhoQ